MFSHFAVPCCSYGVDSLTHSLFLQVGNVKSQSPVRGAKRASCRSAGGWEAADTGIRGQLENSHDQRQKLLRALTVLPLLQHLNSRYSVFSITLLCKSVCSHVLFLSKVLVNSNWWCLKVIFVPSWKGPSPGCGGACWQKTLSTAATPSEWLEKGSCLLSAQEKHDTALSVLCTVPKEQKQESKCCCNRSLPAVVHSSRALAP